MKDCIFTSVGYVMTSNVSLLKPTETRIMYISWLKRYHIPHHPGWLTVWKGSPPGSSDRSFRNWKSTIGKVGYGLQAILSLPAGEHHFILSNNISKISRYVLVSTPWREVVLRTRLIIKLIEITSLSLSRPMLPVQVTIVDRFGQMGGVNFFWLFKVGNCTRYFNDMFFDYTQ